MDNSDCGLTITRLSSLDAETLSNLSRYGSDNLGESALDHWMIPVVAAFGLLYIAESDGRMLGSAQIVRCLQEGDLYMDIFYIREQFRQRGYGFRFLDNLLSELSSLGYQRLLATLDRENEAASLLYRKAGFDEIDFLEDFYGYGRSRSLMSVRLRDKG